MAYKNIAFLLPLLATSSNGGQIGVWKTPQPSAVLATDSSNNPKMGLICPIELECGDGMSASVTISQVLGVTKITVIAGASKDTAIVPSGSTTNANLTIECDGEDIDLAIGTSASSWSAVSSCNQVGVH